MFQPVSIESAYPIIRETVPQSSLGYNTNNKYPQFPPLMSDGRSVTATWQPEATINADLIQSNGIKSNWEYRQFLIKNSKMIMEYNFREASNDVGYYKRPMDLPNIQSNQVVSLEHPPYKFTSTLDKTQPKGYTTSDLKEVYLTREQLDSRKVAPSFSL